MRAPLEEGKCRYPNCNKKAAGIIRCKPLCQNHYNIILLDNKLKYRTDQKIPKKLSIDPHIEDYYLLDSSVF